MTFKTIAPYGRWASAISAEAATAGTKALGSPRSVPGSGRAYFLVSKDDGSSTLYQTTTAAAAADTQNLPDPPRRVLPEPWGVGTTVYEYGGQAYAVMGGGGPRSEDKIVFSDPRDNGCHVLDVATGKVTTLVAGQPALRYGDFDVQTDNNAAIPWLLAVQEDHTHPAPADVRNYIVAIHRETGAVVRVVEGADFYSYPRWAPSRSPEAEGKCGYRLSWRQWDHPDLPFEGVILHWATWHPDSGSSSSSSSALQGAELVAGADRQCVAEAAWAPDGSSLVFGMEAQGGGFRQLFRVRPSASSSSPCEPEAVVLEGLEDVEIGDASWFVGCQTIVFLTPSTIVAVVTRYGQNHLIYADLDTGAWASLDADVGLVEMKFDPLAALSAVSFLVVGSGHTTPQAVYRVDLDVDACRRALAARSHVSLGPVASSRDISSLVTAAPTAVFRSTDQDFAPRIFSTPELIRVPAPGAVDTGSVRNPRNPKPGETHDVYGWFWPPHNRAFAAPEGTLPPLIVTPHGGPTGYSAPGLHMVAQYWATRGFAYFAINYSGSAGHGRAYRDRLWTRWGILDRDDVEAAVTFLTSSDHSRPCDPARVGIEGGSAGGYNVLQSLVGYPALFAGGVCCCGVADTAALARDTHKLESHYLDRLMWILGETTEAAKGRIHRARSPLLHADRIAAPLRLIHGDRDTVVPIEQSRSIQRQIEQRGGDVDLVVLVGEGHMFVKTESLVRYLTAEAEWWEKTLLK